MGSIWRDYAPGVVHDLVVIAAAKLRGKVTPPRGQSAAGLRVVLEGRRNSQFFMGMGTTDANGAFVIDGLRPTNEPAWLVVQGLRGCAETGPLRLDKRGLEGVELKLDPPLEVTGLVIGKSGKPVPGARVALVAAEEKDGVMPGRDLTLSDAQGRFAFKGMGAGTYTLDVTVRGDEVAVKTKPFGVSDKKRSSDQKVKVPTD
jgi:hypothetical protein